MHLGHVQYEYIPVHIVLLNLVCTTIFTNLSQYLIKKLHVPVESHLPTKKQSKYYTWYRKAIKLYLGSKPALLNRKYLETSGVKSNQAPHEIDFTSRSQTKCLDNSGKEAPQHTNSTIDHLMQLQGLDYILQPLELCGSCSKPNNS